MMILTAYSIYLVIAVFTVFMVGKNLHRNGAHYLFAGCQDTHLASSANNFLYTGYCLVNSAFALFFLGRDNQIGSLTQVIEFIAYSQGVILLVLGALHLVNILVAPQIISVILKRKLLTNKNQKS